MARGRTVPDRAVARRLRRDRGWIELGASENHVSPAVRRALGSPLCDLTTEGFPGRRMMSDGGVGDLIELDAIASARRAFGAAHANVQPHSGSTANLAAMLALAEPGERILAMGLASGGHFSHGHPATLGGRLFEVAHYGVRADDGRLDMDAVAEAAERLRPRLIIAGVSSYPRALDLARFRRIADACGARLLVDIAHVAGQVVAGLHPDPVPLADLVTTTSYKNFRGPRGGLILSRDGALARRAEDILSPGLQGTPMMNVIAAKAVACREARTAAYRRYQRRVLEAARRLARALAHDGLPIVTGGTDTPLVVLDLARAGVDAGAAFDALASIGIGGTRIPLARDPEDFSRTSGLRFGTSAFADRHDDPARIGDVADLIAACLASVRRGDTDRARRRLRARVCEICRGARPLESGATPAPA